MTYRDGWRTGRHREAGQFRVVLNPDQDESIVALGHDDPSGAAELCDR